MKSTSERIDSPQMRTDVAWFVLLSTSMLSCDWRILDGDEKPSFSVRTVALSSLMLRMPWKDDVC